MPQTSQKAPAKKAATKAKPTQTPATKPAKGSPSLPMAELDDLATWLNTAPVNEVEVEYGGLRLRLAKGATTAAPVAAAAPQNAVSAPVEPELNQKDTFKSPMIGTYYASPSPDAQPFVKEGDSVQPGQVLCIIEAMKTMNQISSDRAGKVMKILTNNAEPVEFGQPLFIIK